MSRPITPTPVLGPEDTERFLREVAKLENVKAGPVPTPKLKEVLERFIRDHSNGSED